MGRRQGQRRWLLRRSRIWRSQNRRPRTRRIAAKSRDEEERCSDSPRTRPACRGCLQIAPLRSQNIFLRPMCPRGNTMKLFVFFLHHNGVVAQLARSLGLQRRRGGSSLSHTDRGDVEMLMSNMGHNLSSS
jgi:hypothetical protein